jgi:MSHA biogenesis protein MshJ
VAFKDRINSLQSRIDELTLRERGILFFVIVGLLYITWDSMLILPEEKMQKQVIADFGELRKEITALEQESLAIINRHNLDPNEEERRRLEQLMASGDAIEKQMVVALEGLIEPEEMAAALESVLKGQQQLRFVRLENLGAKPLLNEELAEESTAETGIYKHTMRLEIEGSFHHTRDYLQALERLPWKFHWESVTMEIMDYPQARVEIMVNTLSMDEEWLGV